MTKLFSRFATDESGATAVEYSLLASLIALAIIASVKGLRDKLVEIFNNVAAGV